MLPWSVLLFTPVRLCWSWLIFFLGTFDLFNIPLTTFALVLSELADAALRGWDVFFQLFCPKGLWTMKKKTNAMQIIYVQNSGFSKYSPDRFCFLPAPQWGSACDPWGAFCTICSPDRAWNTEAGREGERGGREEKIAYQDEKLIALTTHTGT